MSELKNQFTSTELKIITDRTLNYYHTNAEDFWEGTRDHDVTQNYDAFLKALPKQLGLKLLDFGCGPGRDLLYFKTLGHSPIGLDGSARFCEMAANYSGCPTLNQNFLNLNLEPSSFDGIFANASLFHVPTQKLTHVLEQLYEALVPNGILFSSNPRGNSEGWSGDRFGCCLEWENYREFLERAGFEPLQHYYRPPGLPHAEQRWLAVVARRN